ncbi:TonB-dependent receptor [Endozoicomonas montiporae]|uniref:TonB-dependent receptor n=2 Tax=Endozoicomonas montiporae TaxID=1027273 RepID=A0A081N0S3_9GAMM|nr:TonB-dependent receptor [Endozoicomonas montiporae]AMO54528.1 hypothetical protein EZMO1_0263 [Endozoicomonas montiporae CL-33]KEQ12046.1 TonB-dependent receptor [Endozoicomonas montiporae]
MSRHCIPHKAKFLSLTIAASLSSAAVAQETSQDNESSYMMNQVVVTATKTENNLATAPASMAVISGDELRQQPANSLNDIVKKAVGVESRKDGGRGGREMISIRGMDPKYTMIMVNGRKMSSSNAIIRGNDFDLTSIPQEDIEQIEIIRGPMSALYGSEALGGVVNIITKKPDNEWTSTITGDYSRPTDRKGGIERSMGLNTGGALIDDELFLNLSLNKMSRDAWKPFSGDRADVTGLEERETLGVSGNLSWLIDDRQILDFDVTYSDDEREGFLETIRDDRARFNDSDVRIKRNSVAITHSGEWDWGDSQMRYAREYVESGSMNFTTNRRDYAKETNNAIDGSVTTEINDHRLTFGGEIRKTDLVNKADLSGSGKADVQQEALFIQDEWSLNDDWTLTYGTRLDHHEDFGTEFSPRAYLVNTVTDRLTVKGGVGQAFNAPSLLNLTEDYRLNSCRGDCIVVGNPDLKPETSTSYELAFNYQETNWMVEAAVFRNDIDNLIEQDRDTIIGWEPTDDPDKPKRIHTYKNIDKARVDGIELGGRIELTETLAFRADYTNTHAIDRSTGKRLLNRPRQTVSTQLDWKAMNKLNTFVRATHTGTQKIEEDREMEGYSLIDLGMTYSVTSDLNLRAGVTNISNRQLSDSTRRQGYNIDPRTWYVGFSTTF